jgi:hypothetical protein
MREARCKIALARASRGLSRKRARRKQKRTSAAAKCPHDKLATSPISPPVLLQELTVT